MATRPSTDGAEIAAGEGTCRVIKAGVVDYREAWDWQVRIASAVRDGSEPETLLLLEHPHTYTRGRLAPDSDLLLDEATLAARGIAVVETDRGGLITYHGPGQLIAYPIIRLRGRGGPHWYVRTLEQVIISVLAEFGLEATTVDGRTGVWTSDQQRKIAAIGVKIAGGVAYHGFAINVDPDLTMFDGIIPCGITDRTVTSMAAELGRAVNIDAVAASVAHGLCKGFGLVRKLD
ncbi:MAG: lipoyl(octanoyl) transferase LipB [Chloroflexi bacterium]|nr:lipoyl(octanoyl) transferase LipB [Chloroflexota bacterium]